MWRYSRSHPNILELYGFVRDPGQVLPSLVSPFYELGNARSFVENPPNRALPEAQRIQLVSFELDSAGSTHRFLLCV